MVPMSGEVQGCLSIHMLLSIEWSEHHTFHPKQCLFTQVLSIPLDAQSGVRLWYLLISALGSV
jgi:hypothetical protein